MVIGPISLLGFAGIAEEAPTTFLDEDMPLLVPAIDRNRLTRPLWRPLEKAGAFQDRHRLFPGFIVGEELDEMPG